MQAKADSISQNISALRVSPAIQEGLREFVSRVSDLYAADLVSVCAFGSSVTGDYDAVDAADAEALYRLLESEIVPTFYDRDAGGMPRRWLDIVRQSIMSVTPRFSARRMVKQYAEEMYGPVVRRREPQPQ